MAGEANSAQKAVKAGKAKKPVSVKASKTSGKPKAKQDAGRPQLISDIAAKIIAKPERRITGRPPIYTEELAKEFCRRIAMGRSLRSVCEDEDMPDSTTVFEWKRKQAGFTELYARATEERGLTYGDRITDLVDAVLAGEYEVDRARLALDGLKWTAARLAPKQYGDKQQVEVTADLGATAARVLMDLTQQAREAKAIEHSVIDVTPTLIGDRQVNKNK
jgi:hypothetical protein